MALTIEPVLNRKDLKAFVEYPNKLYKDNPHYVPKLIFDEIETLDSGKNPAYGFSDAEMYLAYRDGRIVGRVAAIVNRRANEHWKHDEVRFGWMDFIDDMEVSKALMDKVIEFGKARGMDRIVGPLGFTDFDPEGMLVEGFDKLSTMALTYNYPYYPVHMEALGMTKVVDWVEFKIFVPEETPERIRRIATIVEQKYDVHIRKLTKHELRTTDIGHRIFELVNETYSDLYNFTQLPKEMMDKYISTYLGMLDLDYVTLVEDSDHNLLAFGISMPSITKALQKSGGKLFPFGWFHILKSLYFKHEESVELLIVGVKTERRNQGLLAMIFDDLIPRYRKGGFKFGETNAELEYNTKVQAPWEHFEKEQTKRRRIYGKSI